MNCQNNRFWSITRWNKYSHGCFLRWGFPDRVLTERLAFRITSNCVQRYLSRLSMLEPLIFSTRALVISLNKQAHRATSSLFRLISWAILSPFECQQIIPLFLFLHFIEISCYHPYSTLIDIYKLGIARKSAASSIGRLGWMWLNAASLTGEILRPSVSRYEIPVFQLPSFCGAGRTSAVWGVLPRTSDSDEWIVHDSAAKSECTHAESGFRWSDWELPSANLEFRIMLAFLYYASILYLF